MQLKVEDTELILRIAQAKKDLLLSEVKVQSDVT